MFNEIYLSDRRRGLLIIPPYVAHAVQNVGTSEAFSSTCPRGPTITPIPTNTASPSIPVKSPTPSTGVVAQYSIACPRRLGFAG
jgi:dTDP-4-dehydrorhamnose 3,5-epimerase-like enzyme